MSYPYPWENDLRDRPLPHQKVRISATQILAAHARKEQRSTRNSRRGWTMAVSVCVLAIIMFGLSVYVHQAGERVLQPLVANWNAGIGRLADEGATDPTNAEAAYINANSLKSEDWMSIYDGNNPYPGLEAVMRTQVDENLTLIMVASEWGDKQGYSFAMGHILFEPDGDEAIQSFGSSAVVEGSAYDDRKLTLAWGSTDQVHLTLGMIVDPTITQIRISNESGLKQVGEIVQNSKGQRFWYSLLTDAMDASVFKAEGLDSDGHVVQIVDQHGKVLD